MERDPEYIAYFYQEDMEDEFSALLPSTPIENELLSQGGKEDNKSSSTTEVLPSTSSLLYPFPKEKTTMYAHEEDISTRLCQRITDECQGINFLS